MQEAVTGGDVDREGGGFLEAVDTACTERGDQQAEAGDSRRERVDVDTMDAVQRALRQYARRRTGLAVEPRA